MSEEYFLSADNALATVDQREIEDRALRLIERPELQRARGIAETLWRNAVAWPARDQMNRFDNMIDEYIFHHAIRAANADPQYPGIMRFMVPKHHWFGRDVPGSRWAGDSPDFTYRTVPIAHGRRYEIRGRPAGGKVPTVNYALMGDNNAAPVSLGLLDSLDMVTDDDGGFLITIDAEPANGRPNHLQTQPGADHLFIRDAIGDWIAESPNALTVRALDPPDRERWSEEMLARRAAKNLIEGFYYSYYVTRTGSAQPPNVLRAPMSSGAFGGMATQLGSKGNLCLEPDDALIVTVTGAGAQFRNLVLTDNFHLSLDYWSRTASLNMDQMAADEDGRFTFVIAHRDPGVHNWIDTCGLRETMFCHRWQAFARDGSASAPELEARLVKFGGLERELPPGVKRIDPAGRADQLAARTAGFARRFVDS